MFCECKFYLYHKTFTRLSKFYKLNEQTCITPCICAAASEPEASEQGNNPNLYMWVKILILPLARCIMVPVGFYNNYARSVAMKCTCVVAVWSFFHCFDFREDRVSFQGEKF